MYEAYFALTASPFQLNPDPSFLFVSKGHRNAHAYLRQGVARGDGMAVVTGEIGAGKTTLIGVALGEIDPARIIAVQLVSTQLDAGNLLRAVALAFGLSPRTAGRAASGTATAPANGVGGNFIAAPGGRAAERANGRGAGSNGAAGNGVDGSGAAGNGAGSTGPGSNGAGSNGPGSNGAGSTGASINGAAGHGARRNGVGIHAEGSRVPAAADSAAGAAENADLIARIEAFLVGLALDGRRAILVVDEAQNLATEAIEMLLRLSDLHSGHHPLLHCLLVGQPELRDLLRTPSMQRLGQRVDAAFHLGPMDREETRAYIEHRLLRVGWTRDPKFDPEAYAVIHRETDGIPRRINTLCNRLLLGASLEDHHTITGIAATEAAAELRLEIDYDERPGTRATINPARKGPPPAPSHSAGHAFTESALSARLDRLERSVEAMARLVEKIA
jgi:type II secretory pathway predicted ATPase ExeA